MAIRRIGFMPPAGGDKPHPCIPGPLFPYRPERRRRYGVSPRRRKATDRTTWGKFQEGGIAIPPSCFKGWIVKAGEIGTAAALPRGGNHHRGPPEAGQENRYKKVHMEDAPARHNAGRCGQKVNCPRGAREAALGRRPPTRKGDSRGTRPNA